MGRSVMVLPNYEEVTYLDCSNFGQVSVLDEDGNDTEELEYDQQAASDDWEDFRSYLIEILQKRCPSLRQPDRKRWEAREVSIILENGFVEIGISDYCGCVSLAVRPKEDDYAGNISGLASFWISQVWSKIEKDLKAAFPKQMLYRLGSMSNGESVYERAA